MKAPMKQFLLWYHVGIGIVTGGSRVHVRRLNVDLIRTAQDADLNQNVDSGLDHISVMQNQVTLDAKHVASAGDSVQLMQPPNSPGLIAEDIPRQRGNLTPGFPGKKNKTGSSSIVSSLLVDPQTSEISGAAFFKVSCESFFLVSTAEIFDKTWFVAMLMAVLHPKLTVFLGCYLALVYHIIIGAVLGYFFSFSMPCRSLHFVAAGIFFFFAALYFRDYLQSDPNRDIITAGKEEAQSSIAAEGDAWISFVSSNTWRVFRECFIAVFIAEWGDRTQIAMISQLASQPLIPVFLGVLLAFFLLTMSAVLAGALLSRSSVSERFVYASSCLCFLVFGLLAINDGLHM